MLLGMAYQVTPAHVTASAARHAGDPVWLGDRSLIIRRANVYPPTQRRGLVQPGGADLGWVEMIGPLLQAGLGIGKTAYDIRMQQIETQRQRSRESDAQAAAAKEAELTRQATAAAGKQAQALSVASQGTVANNPMMLGGIAIAAALGLFLVLRRK